MSSRVQDLTRDENRTTSICFTLFYVCLYGTCFTRSHCTTGQVVGLAPNRRGCQLTAACTAVLQVKFVALTKAVAAFDVAVKHADVM